MQAHRANDESAEQGARSQQPRECAMARRQAGMIVRSASRWGGLIAFSLILALSLVACNRGDRLGRIPPTATPPAPTAPIPTALPAPTPTPGYLDLVKAAAPLPEGHLVFSTVDGRQGSAPVQLWTRSVGRDDVQLALAQTEDRLWECVPPPHAALCAVGDPAGQVYTLTPPEALAPLLPAGDDLQRVFISSLGSYVGVVSGGYLSLLNLADPADLISIAGVTAVGDVAWSRQTITDAAALAAGQVGDSRLAFVTLGERQSLYVMRLGPEGTSPGLIAQEDEVSSPVWAGEQRKLAFIVRGLEHPRGGAQRRDVFVADFETEEYLNITEVFGPAIDWLPAQPFGGAAVAWSPDGNTLDFVWTPPDERPDRGSLYRRPKGMDPELVMPVLEAAGQGWSGPVWSPDGSLEAAVAPIEARDGRGELWVSPAFAESWAARSLPDQAVERFAWSPSGQWLAYDVPGDGIWVVPAAGGEPQRVATVGAPYQVRRLQWIGE